jgi:ABC-2 type transport system permease protein
VRVVGVLVRAGFRRHASYRAATLGGALTNSVFGLLRASIVAAAVTSAGGMVAGYDAAAAVTYAWVTQAVIAPVNVFAWTEVAERVRTGDIAVDLARPVDVQLHFAAVDLGRALSTLLPRALPPLVVGALTFGLVLPGRPIVWLAVPVCVLLAVGVSFACRFLLNLVSFWLLDVRGPVTLYVSVAALLGGLYVPVGWFPGWLHAVAVSTPFPSMVQAPADVISGRVGGLALLGTLATQAGWLVATVVAGRVVLARATRKLVLQGG